MLSFTHTLISPDFAFWKCKRKWAGHNSCSTQRCLLCSPHWLYYSQRIRNYLVFKAGWNLPILYPQHLLHNMKKMQWIWTKMIKRSNSTLDQNLPQKQTKQQKRHLFLHVISNTHISHFNGFLSFPKNFLFLKKTFPHFPNTPLSLNVCQHFFYRVHPNLTKTHTFSLHLLESSKGPGCFSSSDSTPLLHTFLQV